MKRVLLSFLIVLVLSISVAFPAMAGGDKVRGDNGQGDVNQVQIQDPPPFQP